MSKTIFNKKTGLKVDADTHLYVADLLLNVTNRPFEGTISMSDMRLDLKILDILEASKQEEDLPFTVDQLKRLAKHMDDADWVVAHKDIVDLRDTIDSLITG